MKIEILSSDGIQASEKDAIQRMREAFNASDLTRSWHGYAAFMMMDVVYRDREIDLLLLTHDRVLLVELKKWNGTISASGDHWLLNGNDMGRSPVKVLADKWKILSSKVKNALKKSAQPAWIDYRVVLCGNASNAGVPDDERPRVISLDYLLKLATRGAYEKEFKRVPTDFVNPMDHIAEFSNFLKGPQFRPASFSFQNFQIEGDALFSHPNGIYKEFRAVKKDDVRHLALLRRWDFGALVGKADTTDERAKIALREHQVLGYIQEQNEDLASIFLQPISNPTRDDVDADFCELYKLPARQLRLSEFVHRFGPDMRPEERLALLKVLLSHFADLHDTKVAHRDIADHTVWLERPSRVSISGLITAYFPEKLTVGLIRDVLRGGRVVLPEDSGEIGEAVESDPFRRDVFLLGVVSYLLLYLVWPPRFDGSDIFICDSAPDLVYGPDIWQWLKRSMELVPSDRFANAREMLNVLNRADSDLTRKTGLEMAAFDPFRTPILPMVVYPIIENIQHGFSHVYKSVAGGAPAIVKIWYQIRPDPKRIAEGNKLLGFLNKARFVKAQNSDLTPEIIDFGISDAGPYLVQRCCPGVPLADVIGEQRSTLESLRICRALLYAIEHLHGLNMEHGDVSPSNIFSDDGIIRFIDFVDIPVGEGATTCTPAYAPPDFDSVPAIERDCYGIITICREILSPHLLSNEFDLTDVVQEIEQCISRAQNTYRTDKVTASVERLINPKPIREVRQFEVRIKRQHFPALMASDNGQFYVGVRNDSDREDQLSLLITGVRYQLQISIHPVSLAVRGPIMIREVSHSQFLLAANKSLTKFHANISVLPGVTDAAHELLEAVLSLPSVSAQIRDLSGAAAVQEIKISTRVGAIPPEVLWKALIDAEEAVLPEVEVSAPPFVDWTEPSKLRIPYSKVGEPLDYDSADEIEVLRDEGEQWTRIGYLDTKETTDSTLVLVRYSPRKRAQVGDVLKFRSVEDLASFRRRQTAVRRLLSDEAVITDLLSYFDRENCKEPLLLESEPSSEELDSYTVQQDGKILFALNEQQRRAFTNLWTKGPVGLLQGPPGTGKTAFIASFVHYALTKGAVSILLASQSHEAVNNAGEKVIELCHRTGLSVNLVRFGAEGMVSEPLRPYHSSAVLESYRSLCRAELRARVASLSSTLGLPREFVEMWFDARHNLGILDEEIRRISEKLAQMPQLVPERGGLEARLSRRKETIEAIAREKFDCNEVEPEKALPTIKTHLISHYGVHSSDAIRKLEHIITVAEEWIGRLGTQDSKFEEFLAKTRSVVCGTCVGLGRTQFGIAKNQYDWVIVDEAGRATPSELAVAIQCGRRVLLVGDHRQLPPLYPREVIDTVAAELSCNDPETIKTSDFERAFESEYGKHVGVTLRTQYRMAPPIGDLVSACFYPVPLLSGRGDPPEWFRYLPNFAGAVVTWIDTSPAREAAFERRKKGSSSRDNPYEANQVIELLRSISTSQEFMRALLAETGEDEKPIGVICTYADQKRLIQKMLSEQDWATGFRHLLKVDTVDSYQGKENRIIVLSLTANNPRFDQGFLFSPERTNVALSRAMDRLFIVGASRMWNEANTDSPLATVLQYITSHADGEHFQMIDAPLRSGLNGEAQ